MSTTKRYQQGKHLTVVEDIYLPYISNVAPHVIPALAAWYEVCDEAIELVEDGKLEPRMGKHAKDLKAVLDKHLQLSVSVGARGRDDLKEILRAAEEAQYHRDAGQFAGEEKPRGGLRG